MICRNLTRGWHLALCALPVLFVSGCAGYLSAPADTGSIEGIAYYLPKRPIAVQVTIDANGQVQTPTIVAAPAVPDYRHRFILSYETNLIGENNIKIGVKSNGLLQSAASTVTSGLGTIASSIGTIAGQMSAGSAFLSKNVVPGTDIRKCDKSQTYTLLIWPEDSVGKTLRLCDFYILVGKAPSAIANYKPTPRVTSVEGSSGVFYRTEIPYLVGIMGIAPNSQASFFVAYSPDQSPVSFLPIERTLFAKNITTVTLSDGMVTEYDQDDNGEVVGLIQIPATVASAYFTAIGGMFSSLSTVDTSRNNAAVTEAKRQVCAAAIAANPLNGKAGAELDTAYANIKAACSS